MKKIRSYYRLISMMIILIFLLTGQNLFAQAVEVSGIIKDENGKPIIGATVLEKGTSNGTLSNLNGEFRLTVSSKDAVLQVSFIGLQSKEIPLNGQTFFNIIMTESVLELSEVVVIGYGQQKKESVIGAISQLSTDEILSTAASNITQAISGKISGVITSQASGIPGSDNAQIYIRGRATFAGDAQPIVLVDGVERDFSQIAPDDIQTISVLKDASATAVYGVRGANGVILVTTKRGQDQKPVVSLTANWQSQSPTRKDTYLNSYQSVLLLEEALSNDNLPSQFSASDIEMYRKSSAGELSGVDALLYPDVDWYKTILRSSAPSQRYNVNVQGGTKRIHYFVSGEYYNQRGLFKNLSLDKYGNESNTNFRRYGFRSNLDYLLSKNLKMSVNFGTRFEERTGPNASESEIFYELNHSPGWLFPVSYTVGEEGSEKILYGGTAQYQNNIAAQFAVGGFYKATNTINEINGIVDYNLDWLTKGLKAKGMMSFDYNAYYNRRFIANFSTYELIDRNNYNSIEAYNRYGTDSKLSYAGANHSNIMKIYFEFQLNYARRFGMHDVTAMVLYNQNDRRANAALPQRYQGLVGRVTYSYKDRYLMEFNAGYNGSENFAKGNRFGFFPAFSIGWRITQEEFMASTQNWLNNLKIRGTYGQVGNDNYRGQRFLYEEKWIQGSNYIFGTTTASTISEGAYPNFRVTWERAVKYNLGIEIGLWKDLLKGNIDFFSETRDNILTDYLSRPMWIGVSMVAGNLGKTKNSGFEIELNHARITGRNFDYYVGLTYAHAKNEIINMDEPESKTDYRKREGHSIGQYFGLVSEGFITAADLANPNLPVSTYGDVKVGDLKYKDANNDGYIDERDVMAIGYNDVPENTFSLTSGFNYKGLGFNMVFQGVSHVSRYYDAEAMYAFINGGKVKEHHLGRWDPSQSEAYNLTNAKYPLLHYDNFGDHNQRLNSFFLQNGAFIRLKNIELSYTLPASWTKSAGISNCKLYVNANNLFTWDHLNSIADPESNGSNRYPIMKTINFGVNVKF
ncbi:MAG: TonB-dependent receptor [Bacteroidales bacterium]|nr:TonB-dependent receptor [Bacteroidales bacterium]